MHRPRPRPATALFVCVFTLAAAFVPTPVLAETWSADIEQRPVVAGQSVVDVDPFDMVAVSWTGSAAVPPPVEVRKGGLWNAISSDTPGPDAGPDDHSAEARHEVTTKQVSDPVWVGSADGYRVGALRGAGDVTVHLIRQQRVLRPAVSVPAAGATAAPADGPLVRLRDSWGAAPAKQANDVARSIKFAVIHHTAGTNDYTQADVPSILRGIQSFHQNTRGWNDIAYNFLIDKWGNVWEGRSGGIGKAIIGSHAANFNTGTVGISLMGDFATTAPPQAMIDAAASVAGWKLAMAAVNPQGTTTVVGTSANVFPDGQTVTIPTIVGHRDVGTTDCPGLVWNYLPQIRAAAATRAAYVNGVVDTLTVSSAGRLAVSGWAYDRRTPDPTGIVIDVNGQPVLTSATSVSRLDVQSVFTAAPPNSGFDLVADLPDGDDTVCVYAAESSYGALRRLTCQSFRVNNNPRGALESVTASSGSVAFSGWSLDPNTTDPISVQIFVDGTLASTVTADVSRPDIAAANPGSGPLHGFNGSTPVSDGPHRVCAYGINTGAGSANPLLGCRSVGSSIPTENPIGGIDAISSGGLNGFMLGWTIDRDSTGPISARVTVNGRTAALVTAGATRAGLSGVYPEYGDAHGFFVGYRLDPGPNRVCLVGVNVGPGTDSTIACRDMAYDPDPTGGLDGVSRSGRRNAVVTGWTLDRDTTGPSPVLIRINGRTAGLAQSGLPRPWLDYFFPGYGDNHGFRVNVALPRGRSNVCAYALNVGPGRATTTLGCRLIRR